MSQLVAQCTFCQTTFKVSDTQMQAVSGVVRCGDCMEVFLASQHLVILKERPAPVAMEEDEIKEKSFNDTNNKASCGDGEGIPRDDPFDDTPFDAVDENLEGVGEEAENDTQLEVIDADDVTAESACYETDTFKSWVQEENYRRSETRAWFSCAEDIDENDESAWVVNGEEPEETKDLIHEKVAQAQESVVEPDTELLEKGEQPEHEGVQLLQVPTPARTTVIISDERDRIPTLGPDVVAREDVPAASTGPQILGRYKLLRKSLRDSRARKTVEPEIDEKAEICRRLEELRADESLELVDSACLDTLTAEPVVLADQGARWTRLQFSVMLAASTILLFSLAGQYFWFNQETLALSRRMPAITDLLCQMRTCPDLNGIDLSTLVTEELVVRSHPKHQDALQVDFIFRNDNSREQRFPLVEMNFISNDGDVIANRAFASAEYLPPEMQLFTHMPAHSSIQVSLELVDPGVEATGYYLVLRNP
jgi:predicted Zn finger-like uncharacterized protein